MAAGKVVGQIQVAQGNIKVIGVDGSVREPNYEGYVYENEQVISNDPNALFQIKFLALPESSAYDGIFRILTDGSVIHGRDAMDSMMSDENLVKALETAAADETAGKEAVEDLETAAGEEGTEGNSQFTETEIVADSSVLGFFRGANGELGFGITDFGSVPNYDAGQIAPPVITSPNVVIYDENDTIPVIQITATAEGDVTYSISGLDSDFFNIDPTSGLVTFKESPDFENPRDAGGDNEYNTYVTVTDTYGNYTTQLLSVSINNVNEPVTAYDDAVNAVEDTILSSTIDLDANDYDVDGDDLSVVAGEFETAEGGTIVIAANGSYTYAPPANFNGVDSVNYTVTDGEFTDVGTLTINVAPVNDAPVTDDVSASGLEDAVSIMVTLSGNDDLDDINSGTVEYFQLQGLPANGLLYTDAGLTTLAATGTNYAATGEELNLYFVPNSNWNGESTFDYVAIDNNGAEDASAATATITVDPDNDAPILDLDLDESESGANFATTFTEGDEPISIADTDSKITDVDDTHIESATVTLTNAQAGDVLNTPADGTLTFVTDTSVPGEITVTITGSDTLAAYEDAIEGITFENTSENPDTTPRNIEVVVNDGDTDSNTAVTTITVNAVNDAPTIQDSTIEATEDIVYNITLDDFPGFEDIDGDDMTHIRIDELPDNGILRLYGVDVEAGDIIEVADINAGALYLTTLNNGDDTSFTFSASDGTDWSETQTMTVNITPVTDTVKTDTLSVSMTVLPPVIDTSTLTMSDDTNTALNIFQTADGLKLTGPDGTTVQVNTNGNGLGIDSGSGSNDPRDVEGGLNEWLQIEFPTGTTLNEINIDVKHASDDVVKIELYDASSDPINSGITYQIDGKGTVYTLGSDGLIDGSLLSGNAAHTITIISATSFAVMLISDDNTGASGGTDGFSVLNVYGTVSSTPGSYDSIIHLDGLGLGDTDGSEEISTVTFSGFPADSIITLPDGVTEIVADTDGNWVIDAADLGLDPDLDLTNDISMTLTSPIAISSSFVPTIDIVTTEIGAGVPDSHTILGGSEDSVLVGEDGNDYIRGGDGDDTISGGDGVDGDGSDILIGGAGNDTLAYDISDFEIDGGAGVDTLIGDSETVDLSNVSGIEVIQLNAGTTVTGSGIDLGINASDVINATDGGTLIIQSADGSSLNQVNIDETSFTQGDDVNIGGIDYAQYTGMFEGDTATLYIELNDDITVD